MIDRDLKKGDVISIRAVVKHDQSGDEYVHVRIGGEFKPTVTVDRESIIAFIQPKVAVEDVVCLSDDREQSGIVRAVWDAAGSTLIWVERSSGSMETWRACDVEVVYPPTLRPPRFPAGSSTMDEMAEAASQSAMADSDRRAES